MKSLYSSTLHQSNNSIRSKYGVQPPKSVRCFDIAFAFALAFPLALALAFSLAFLLVVAFASCISRLAYLLMNGVDKLIILILFIYLALPFHVALFLL